MTPETWQEIDTLARRALERRGEDRQEFLDAICGGDGERRRRVEDLIATYERARGARDTVLVRPPVAPPPVVEVAAGDRLGGYRLLAPLGRGGMATVWLAEAETVGGPPRVALKVAERGFDDREQRRVFDAEKAVLERLDHPGIRRLLTSDRLADGRAYLVLELVDGLPIDHYCERRGLDLVARLALFLEVCDAVAHAHRHHVVHRDLKPANILVTAAGEPKLLDFGIALRLDAGEVLGERPMTPHYASPEQLRGEAVTASADVYSLGVVLYLLLSGRLPYGEGEAGPREMLRRHAERLPDPPSAALRSPLPPRLASALDRLVAKALAAAPAARFGSVEELARELAKLRRRALAPEALEDCERMG